MDRNFSPGGIDRRTFLIGGGLLAVSPWILGAALPSIDGLAAHGPLHRLAGNGGPRLSVGYLDGGESPATAAGLPFGAGGRVVPAAALRSGERDLAGGAVRFRLLGATPGLDVHPNIRDVDLDALFPVAGHDADDGLVPFYAWTHRSHPQPRTSPGSAFPAPAGYGPAVGFRLTVTRQGRPSAESAPAPSTAVFTTGREPDMARLRRGVYLLGFEPDAWSRPVSLPHPDDPAWAALVSLVVAVDRA
ncbi:MAG: hypothetical protein QOI86_778 [Actinomycetota bacterium]|nr:hypothetical protein [Actinomycetota bacterium]